MMRSAAVWMALSWVAVPAEAQDQAGPATEAAREALDAADRLQKSVAGWRDELGQDGVPDPATIAELEKRLNAAAGEIRLLSRASAARGRNAAEVAKQWTSDLRAIGLGADRQRAQALDEIRAALKGADAEWQLGALRALSQTGDVKYDRSGLRDLLLPILKEGQGDRLTAAFYALYNVDRQPADLQLVQEAYRRDPRGMSASASHLLFSFSGGKIEGNSESIVLELLNSRDRNVRREALRGLWGARVSDVLADRLVELVADPESHHDAIYFGVSTLSEKNEAIIDCLIETLTDPDWVNNGGRALWGLGFGVPDSLKLKVASALVDLHNGRTDPRTREACQRLVAQYGGQSMVARLERE